MSGQEHFTALKNEQTARIVLRDTALYVFIGTVFGIYAAEGQAGANTNLVEIIRACSTAVSAIMFSIYLSNDYYVSRIGQFARSADNDFSSWEDYHRKGALYVLQKYFRSFLVVALFAGWTLYQAIPILEHGSFATRVMTIFFSGLVAFELLLFALLHMKERR